MKNISFGIHFVLKKQYNQLFINYLCSNFRCFKTIRTIYKTEESFLQV